MFRQSQNGKIALLPGNRGHSQTHTYMPYNANHPEISTDVHHSHMMDRTGHTCMTYTIRHTTTSSFIHYRDILAELGHQGITNIRYSNLRCALTKNRPLRSRGLREEGQQSCNQFHHGSLVNQLGNLSSF